MGCIIGGPPAPAARRPRRPRPRGPRRARRTLAGAGGGSVSRTRDGPTGVDTACRVSICTFLASIRPLIEGYARLDPALQHRDDRGQRHLEGLDAAVRAVAAGGGDAVRDLDRLDPVHHRPAQRVGQPDADLEVAGVGGVVAEQHQVVGAAPARRAPRPRPRSRAPRRPGRTDGSASTSTAAVAADRRAPRAAARRRRPGRG